MFSNDGVGGAIAAYELLTERLEDAVARARDDGRSDYVLLIVDVDGFTAVSASYGKEASARLLDALGHRIRACLHEEDVTARYGCDEFFILVRCSGDSHVAAAVSERMRGQLASPFAIEDRLIAVSVSVGIARVRPSHHCASDVIRDAYAAVHHAKIEGGNQCTLFDAGMHEKTRARLHLEAELRQAFDRREFVLHYMPIVSVMTGRLVSLEALIRWAHPTRGCLPPAEFIDVLLATGLMKEVTRWIVSDVCRQLITWRRHETWGDAHVSINVSPRQLEPGFVEDVTAILEETGVSPGWIAFEITEDVELGGGERTIRALSDLRDRGIRVRLDDFGTGYSSLSYLQRLPIHGLKIDRSFLDHIESNPNRREIVGAIIRLAHVLGLDVVAEGVERQTQEDALRALHCDLIQGFHISPAITGEAIVEWMEENQTACAV